MQYLFVQIITGVILVNMLRYSNCIIQRLMGQEREYLEKDVDRGLKRYKSELQIGFVCWNVALGFFYYGYCLIYLGSLPLETVLSVYPTGIEEGVVRGILSGCIPLGGLLGSLSSSFLISHFSRRHCLLLIGVFALIAGALIFIPNLYSLIFFRICQGFCAGVFCPLGGMILKQLAPIQISGSLGSLLEINLCLGTFVAYVVTYILKKATGDLTCASFWRLVFAIPQFFIILQMVVLLYWFPYQTPKYLLQQGRQDEALELISVIYLPQYVEDVFYEKQNDLVHTNLQITKAKNFKAQITSTTASVGNKIKATTIIGLHLAAMQQFAGINAINIYCDSLVAHNADPQLSLMMSSLMNLQKLITVFASFVLLSYFGRKTILQFGTIITSSACACMAAGFFLHSYMPALSQQLIVIGLFTFMGGFGVSIGPITWLYVPQIVQPELLGFMTTATWVASFLDVTLFPILTTHLLNGNPAFLFVFFATYLFVSFIFNHKYLLQTKDKTQKQIREEYEQSPLNVSK